MRPFFSTHLVRTDERNERDPNVLRTTVHTTEPPKSVRRRAERNSTLKAALGGVTFCSVPLGLTRTHASWSAMIERVLDPRSWSFARYGGRGISICPEWQGEGGFLRFVEDLGPRPSLQHTLDRIDADGNYEPSNCRWATQTEQSNNKSRRRTLSARGETLTIAEWSRRVGVSDTCIANRLSRGATPEQALAPDTRPNRRRRGS